MLSYSDLGVFYKNKINNEESSKYCINKQHKKNSIQILPKPSKPNFQKYSFRVSKAKISSNKKHKKKLNPDFTEAI